MTAREKRRRIAHDFPKASASEDRSEARTGASGSRGMTDVTFAVLGVEPEHYSVTPVLNARLGIAAVGDDPIHTIALRCQVRIEPMRRGYSDDEAAGLVDLFGPRDRWATTLRAFQWLQTSAMVQGFSGATQVDL